MAGYAGTIEITGFAQKMSMDAQKMSVTLMLNYVKKELTSGINLKNHFE